MKSDSRWSKLVQDAVEYNFNWTDNDSNIEWDDDDSESNYNVGRTTKAFSQFEWISFTLSSI